MYVCMHACMPNAKNTTHKLWINKHYKNLDIDYTRYTQSKPEKSIRANYWFGVILEIVLQKFITYFRIVNNACKSALESSFSCQ